MRLPDIYLGWKLTGTGSVSMFIFGIISIEVWHTQFPVWAFVLALIICTLSIPNNSSVLSLIGSSAFVYTIPIGMIQAITNQQIGLK